MELNVVPAFAVSVSPQIVVVPRTRRCAPRPSAGPRAARDGHQRRKRAGLGDGSLKTPAGWRVSPAAAAIRFTPRGRVDDDALHGDSRRRRRAGGEQRDVRRGRRRRQLRGTALRAWAIRSIEYPHIQRRHKIVPAVARFKVIDVAVRAGVDGRLHHGRRRPGAGGACSSSARASASSTATRWRGATSRDTTPSSPACAPTKSAPICAPTITGCLKYVENGGTAIVQYNRHGVQSGAVRAVPGADELRAHRRRERAGQESSCPAIRSSTFPTS